MTDRKAYKRDWMAQWRAENPGLLYADTKPFAGVDGEGGTTATGKHDYFMLRAGEALITSQNKLRSEQCLAFLADLPKTFNWVSFFFDYDVTKILQDLPFERIHRLLNRNLRIRIVKGKPTGTCYPIDWEGFQIDYLPRKEFRVRRFNHDGFKNGGWTIISDVGSFFQKAFAEVIETWKIGTDEGRRAIASGKSFRNRFDVSQFVDIDKYNHLECRYLAELMENFRATCKRAGYVPRKWQGPGLIAEEMFRVHGIPQSRKVPVLTDPKFGRLLEFAQGAFYGGRPEVTIVGHSEPCHQWDINSAYPWALLHVPCLIHGTWRHYTQGTPVRAGELAIHYGHFYPKPKSQNVKLWGLPVRQPNGTIHYPGEAWGWYWNFEISAASHQVFDSREAFVYISHCDCEPFSWIRDVYDMRVRLGKDTLGIILKLALNSLYGKIAQSIGSPKYANPIWASFITAYCRTMVQELVHMGTGHKRGRCGEDVLMIATDAIFTTSELPIADSKLLGGYSLTDWDDGIFIVQPGMYYARNTVTKPKTRGVPRNRMEELRPDFLRAFSDMWNGAQEALDPLVWPDGEMPGPVPVGSVRVPLKAFVGLRLAIHRHKLELAGTWIGCECVRVSDHKPECEPWEKEISFDVTSKRRFGLPKWKGNAAWISTYPHDGTSGTITVPYSKNIGGLIEREEQRMELYDQPDWASVWEPPVTV